MITNSLLIVPSVVPRRSRVAFVALALAILAAVVASSRAEAVGILDQQQTTITSPLSNTSVEPGLAQTYTAGITGSQDRVDVRFFHDAGLTTDVTVQIRATTLAGVPSAILATEVVPLASLPAVGTSGWVEVIFDPPVAVTAGTRYAIAQLAQPTPPANQTLGWDYADGNPYPTGTIWISGSGGATWFAFDPNRDFVFKTYVSLNPLIDADGDGICNRDVRHPSCTGSDICPGTALGAPVDSRGCAWIQVDANLDGICDRDKTSDRWCRRR